MQTNNDVTSRKSMARPSLMWSLWCWLLISTCQATVLQDFDFPELVSQSQLIFVGSVQNQREEQQGDLVTTLVTFKIETVFKRGFNGEPQAGTLELSFVGGQSSGLTVQVSGQFIPAVGARGVFFVGKPGAKQVNALTGWQQGYFPLVKDPAGADYLDMRQRPDLKVPGLIVDPLVTKMQGMGFSADAIAAKIPRAYLFSLDDFHAAIVDEISRQGAVP